MQIPEIDEFTVFFGTDPLAVAMEDGYCCYEVTDERGFTLRFSFNLFEQSVQTQLSFANHIIASVSHEFANSIQIVEGTLHCEFSSRDSKTNLTVGVGREVSLDWRTVRIA